MYTSFNYENNIFKTKFFKNFIYTTNRNDSDIDIILAGSFITEIDYNYLKNKNCYKILWISEPVENHFVYPYKLILENKFDLLFGCINNDISNNKYKLPLYINYYENYNDINYFNNLNINNKVLNLDNKKFCCLICRHDRWKTRTIVHNKLKQLGNIVCPSKLFNNASNEELNKIGKKSYLKSFIFNICPENSINKLKGYITEKLMDSCISGCIPIYYGDLDDTDKKIFNLDRIIQYNPNDVKTIDNVVNKIKQLLANPKELIAFYNQDIFLKDANELIYEMVNNFNSKITTIT